MNRIEQSFLQRLSADTKLKQINSSNAAKYKELLPVSERVNLAFGAESPDGSPYGVAALLEENSIIDIKKLIVTDAYRRNKIGSMLVNRVKQYADENGIDTVTAEYLATNDEKQALDDFYRSNGFIIKDATELVMFKTADIAENETFKKLCSVSSDGFDCCEIAELPAEAKRGFAEMLKNPAIAELSPSYAKGRIIDELSLAHTKGGEVKAFIVITDFNGVLYINSAYADPSAATAAVRLINASFNKIIKDFGNFEYACVSAANEGSMKLIANFIGNDKEKTQTVCSTAAECSLSAELGEYNAMKIGEADAAAAQTADGMQILVPKTMRLCDILNEREIPCDLTILDDETPALLTSVDENPVIMRYEANGDSFNDFTIVAYCFVKTESDNIEKLCCDFNGSQFDVTAVPAENGNIIIRASLCEGASPVKEDAFDYFVRTYTQQLTAFTKFEA